MNDIKLTIITVSYNAVATIEQTISSVINQSYPNIEYIIIDGGSTDGTVDIIKKYKDKIAYWISEPDGGIYDAMNKGIKVATGEYVYFLGADDTLIDISIIQAVVCDMSDNPSDIYSYGVYCVNNKLMQKYVGNSHAKKHLDVVDMVPHQGLFVKRSIAVKLPYDVNYKITADYKFFLQCYRNKEISIRYEDYPVALYAMDGVSSNSVRELRNERIKIFKELGLVYSDECATGIKLIIKTILRKAGILMAIRKMRNLFLWKHHKCTNELCRWCGRYNL